MGKMVGMVPQPSRLRGSVRTCGSGRPRLGTWDGSSPELEANLEACLRSTEEGLYKNSIAHQSAGSELEEVEATGKAEVVLVEQAVAAYESAWLFVFQGDEVVS